jgi:hypothetical protein
MERVTPSEIKADIENTFDILIQYASENSRDDDVREAKSAFARVTAFLTQCEADEKRLSEALAALREIGDLVNEPAENEQAITRLFHRIGELASAPRLAD